ncbi:MAG: tetratricopeptide repeat protein, partial [Rhodanobacter sp.]
MAHPSTQPPPAAAALLEQAARSFEQGRVEAGEALLVDHLRQHPGHVEAHLLLARGRLGQHNIDGAALAVDAALHAQPGHAGARLLGARIALLQGQPLDARTRLDELAAELRPSADLAHDIAQLYMQLDLAAEAEPHFARALALEPGNTGYLYNHATALIALGRLDEAERALDTVITREPRDHDAWYNRSTLRHQTRQHNHVEAIESQLRQPGTPAPARVALGYALAKEREDLGDHAAAFDALKKAADTRRSMLAYRVQDD